MGSCWRGALRLCVAPPASPAPARRPPPRPSRSAVGLRGAACPPGSPCSGVSGQASGSFSSDGRRTAARSWGDKGSERTRALELLGVFEVAAPDPTRPVARSLAPRASGRAPAQIPLPPSCPGPPSARTRFLVIVDASTLHPARRLWPPFPHVSPLLQTPSSPLNGPPSADVSSCSLRSKPR